MLVIVFVSVRPLVMHPDNPLRDAVRLLCQPTVFVIAVQVLRIFRDAVIPPYPAAALRVKLRVWQTVSRRVGGIKEGDVKAGPRGMHPSQASGFAVVALPRLPRPADAHQPSGIIVTVLPVKLRVVQALALKLSAEVIGGALFTGVCPRA